MTHHNDWWGRRAAVSVGLCGLVPLLMGGCKGVVDEQANAALLSRLGDTSFTLFPAYIRGGPQTSYSAEEAARLGSFLSGDGLGTVTVVAAEVPITGPWHSNQSKMLRESVDAFRAYLAAHPVDTDYALLAEFLIGGRGAVGGIHCYVLDKDGQVAHAVLLNSHHKAFSDANPKTPSDCTGVLTTVLREQLRRR